MRTSQKAKKGNQNTNQFEQTADSYVKINLLEVLDRCLLFTKNIHFLN